MTDLDSVEYAVQVVLAKCRNEERIGAGVPPGTGVMKWFAAALREAKSIREPKLLTQPTDFPCYCSHCQLMRASPPVMQEMTDGEFYLGVTH